jgi:DNA helicase-2/ATP-dependent DNA helicase PcrA
MAWSYSKIESYYQCPQKFRLRYIEKVPTETKGTIHTFFGSMLHNVIERMYLEKEKGRISSLNIIFSLFEEEWKREFSKEELLFSEKEPEFFEEGKRIIREFYSRFLEDESKTLFTETQFYLDLDGRQYCIRIDRLSKTDGIFEVRDYKTGKPKTRSDLLRDYQLKAYALWVFENYPDAKKVRLIWHYLRNMYDVNIDLGKRDVEETKAFLKQRIDRVERAIIEDRFPAIKSPLCNYCDYMEICKKRQT